MFKLRHSLSILSFVLLLVACSSNLLSESQQESTNSMSSDQIAKSMSPFLPAGAKWTSPLFGKNRTPFFSVDLNHDQQDEGIGLFQLNNQVGIIIIQRDGQKWKKTTQEIFNGKNFNLLEQRT